MRSSLLPAFSFTSCRSRGALAMYAWGEGGRGDRRGTSNVPEPPETAVAATMSREEKVASIPPVIVVEEQPCTQTVADSSSDVCSVDFVPGSLGMRDPPTNMKLLVWMLIIAPQQQRKPQ